MYTLSKKDKQYEDIKNNPQGRSFHELKTLLERFGFNVDTGKGKGSHCPVSHEKHTDLTWTMSIKKPMKIYHAREVIKLVEEVMDRE